MKLDIRSGMKYLGTSLLACTLMVGTMCFAVGAVDSEVTTQEDKPLVILHTNDVHGALTGYAKIAALKAEYEANGAEVLLVDAGDFLQGTIYVSESKGQSATDLMSATGYDYVTVGNHEFDYGFDNLMTVLEGQSFEVVTANAYMDGELIFDDNAIYTTESGLKVGIFGLDTPETSTKANPSLMVGITFDAAEDMYATAQAQIDELRAEGCDLVVCLAHLGIDSSSAPNRSTDVYDNVTGLDIMIDGHSHSTIIDNDASDGILVSAGSSFSKIGVLTVDADGGITSSQVTVSTLTAVDAEIEEMANTIIDEIDEMYGEVFASTEVKLDYSKVRYAQTNIGQLITDAMMWKSEEQGYVVDAAITNGGGIRANIAKGDITKSQILTVLPYSNTMVSVTLTGAELLEALEASCSSADSSLAAYPQTAGLEFTIDTTVPYVKGDQYPGSTYYAPANPGSRVNIISVGGRAFDLEDSYTIVTNDFCAGGGDTYYVFANDGIVVKFGVGLEASVIEYIEDELDSVVTAEAYSGTDGLVTHLYGYTVSFDAGEGSCDTTTQTTVGGAIATLPTATLEGYTFSGWYLDGELVTADTIFTADSTVTAGYTAVVIAPSAALSLVLSDVDVAAGTATFQLMLDSVSATKAIYFTMTGAENATMVAEEGFSIYEMEDTVYMLAYGEGNGDLLNGTDLLAVTITVPTTVDTELTLSNVVASTSSQVEDGTVETPTVDTEDTFTLTEAKAEKLADIQTALEGYTESDYLTAEWTALVALFEGAVQTVTDMTQVVDVTGYDVSALIADADAIATKLERCDLNGDGDVTYADIACIIPYFGYIQENDTAYDATYDIDSNGSISSEDYLMVYANMTI